MDLQVSLFLLFILFTAGHALYCYECVDVMGVCIKKLGMCPYNAVNCVSSTVVLEIGGISSKTKVHGCSLGCESGSMNFGIVKSSQSCCGTSFCNAREAQDPRTIVPNGKKCYYCDGYSCSNILSCSGTEDRCITATGTFEGQAAVVKGCASKAICDSKALASVHDISCCKGNLCNDDESATESVTPSFIQNATQSFFYDGDKSVTESATQSFIQSVTQSFVHSSAEIVKHNDAKSVRKSFMYNDAKSVRKSFVYIDAKSAPYNVAQRVTQSFLFLCCSLLSFNLLH
ncbi:urokinase plasminogen activator surface receptor-like [Garra rufa]|uniref:urokinase plasminogen activator surface receptor-like n=1 Tax=Garra rufa TaxID=137080 RepID=UPI003CCE8C94